jgi:hypothetical protein
MLVDFAVSFDPGVELALADRKPVNVMRDRDVSLIAPFADKVNDGVSCIMGNPDAG